LGYKRQQEKEQNYRIRFQACNVGTAQTLDKTSDAFYNNLPWDMQYDYVDSLDVDALEVLLAQVSLSLILILRFKGLLLYTGGVLFRVG